MLAHQDDVVSLVRLAQAGDQEAFAGLVQLYENELCGYLTSLLGNRNEAQDCAQQAFFKAWEKLSTLKDEASFRSWLYIIARNMACDSLRRRRKISYQSWEGLAEFNDIESTLQVEAHATQAELIKLALAELPPKLRECLCLDACGCSRHEIAKILGISTNSISTYICMARKLFRQAYSCLDHES